MRETGVALLSAREALRSRSAIVVGLVLVGGAAALWWGVSGDGSPAGRLRAFLAWGSDLSWLLLSLVAVFLSTSLGRAVHDGRITPLCLAPIDRARVLLAWWSGVALVLLGLTALSMVTLQLLSRASVALADEPVRPRLESILQARGVSRAPLPERDRVREQVEERLAARVEREGLPEGMTFERAAEIELERELVSRRTVRPGQELAWTYAGVEPAPGSKAVTLRFYYLVHDPEARLAAGKGPRGLIGLVPPGSPGYDLAGAWVGAGGTRVKRHEVRFPIEMLEGYSEVLISYRLDPEAGPITVEFPGRGPELLFPHGRFEPNLVRAGLVLWGRLLFLCALGVVASAVLDPKLAALVALFFLAVGSAHGFLFEALRPAYDAWGPTLGPPMRLFLKGVLHLIPDLGREDLAQKLSDGERVDLQGVVQALFGDGLGRGGAFLLLGAWLFSRRELGAVRGG